METKKIELRPYQNECIEKVNSLPDGTRTIVCLATGLGKTVTAANFKSKGRILWLAHRDELVKQPKRYFDMLGKSYGIEKASDRSDGEDVVSASIQTISRDDRLTKFPPDEFDLIICDEAQHAAAETYKKVLGYFHPRKLIGLTATPKRGDNVRLTDVFDDICFTRDLKWGIENGYLSRIRCVRVSAKFDLKKIKTSMGDLAVSSMQKEMLASDDDIVVVKAYEEYSIPEHKKTLIYCPTIKVCNKVYDTMTDLLKRKEIEKIRVLSDKTPASERKDILDKYNSTDEIDCIINCMILTEGTDLPETSVIINNRPTANGSLYQQIVGRGTRLAKGKEYCLIVDVVGENSLSRNLCTAPTLFGIEPDVLPDSVQKKLYGEDLLDITEDIKENRIDRARAIAIRKELIDIFTGERIKILEENKEKDLTVMAEAYSKMLAKGNTDKYDFGDLMVKTGAEDDRYFCIPATYNGNIYISRPDMLGKSIITIDIPKKETISGNEWNGTSDPMPVKSAIETVSMIVTNGLDERYRCRWSKKARENMSKAEATERQTNYVEVLYDKKTQKKLNKLEASDLIELSNEIKIMKSKSQKLAMLQKAAEQTEEKDKKKRNYKQQLKAHNEELERIKEKEKNAAHISYRQIIKECIAFRERNNKIYEDFIQNKESKKITVTVPSRCCMSYIKTATDKQLEYVKGMEKELAGRNYKIEKSMAMPGMDMYRINFVISLLQTFKRMSDIPEGYECFIRTSDYIEKLKAIDPKNIKDNILECRYDIRIESPDMEELTYSHD